MREVVIVEAGRSPIGKKKGALSSAHPTEMLAQVMVEVLKRAKVAPTAVGQVIGGCINKVGAQAFNVTRTAWLTAGLSPDVACSTIDSQCGSSQFAINLAASMISSGAEDVVLACGVENMSLLPIGSDAIAGAQAGMGKPITRRYREHFEFTSQFEGAERIVTKYGITRDDTDRFGLESQLRAACAISEGRFDSQLVPIEVPVIQEGGVRTGETRVVTRATRFPGRPALRRSPRLSRLLVLTESTPQVHPRRWRTVQLPCC
jgi:acetyl-CoA C-acetyltransferase